MFIDILLSSIRFLIFIIFIDLFLFYSGKVVCFFIPFINIEKNIRKKEITQDSLFQTSYKLDGKSYLHKHTIEFIGLLFWLSLISLPTFSFS